MTVIKQYINRMEKQIYPPYGYPGQNYLNDEPVIIWMFWGDGAGDFEELSNRASKKVVKDYLVHLELQMDIAKEYLKEVNNG